ncbi:unnamed protein product, partial [Porites lobata]
MADGGFDSSASSSTASETRMSTDNVPVDNCDNSSEESQSDQEQESSEGPESEGEEISSEDSDNDEETDLGKALAALRARDTINDVLKNPVPSATQSAALVNLMTNVTEQLEGYQSESDIGPALHAARQVAYWSSVFVSMMSDNASSILDTSNGYSACTTATLT